MHILEQFYFFLCLFNSFSLISASRITNTMLNKSDESVHPCISPELDIMLLAVEYPWTEEPGGLQSIALQRARHDWSDLVKKKKKNYVSYGFVIYRPYYVEVCPLCCMLLSLMDVFKRESIQGKMVLPWDQTPKIQWVYLKSKAIVCHSLQVVTPQLPILHLVSRVLLKP